MWVLEYNETYILVNKVECKYTEDGLIDGLKTSQKWNKGEANQVKGCIVTLY